MASTLIEFDRFVGLQSKLAAGFIEIVQKQQHRSRLTIESNEPAWQFVLDYPGDTGHYQPDA